MSEAQPTLESMPPAADTVEEVTTAATLPDATENTAETATAAPSNLLLIGRRLLGVVESAVLVAFVIVILRAGAAGQITYPIWISYFSKALIALAVVNGVTNIVSLVLALRPQPAAPALPPLGNSPEQAVAVPAATLSSLPPPAAARSAIAAGKPAAAPHLAAAAKLLAARQQQTQQDAAAADTPAAGQVAEPEPVLAAAEPTPELAAAAPIDAARTAPGADMPSEPVVAAAAQAPVRKPSRPVPVVPKREQPADPAMAEAARKLAARQAARTAAREARKDDRAQTEYAAAELNAVAGALFIAEFRAELFQAAAVQRPNELPDLDWRTRKQAKNAARKLKCIKTSQH